MTDIQIIFNFIMAIAIILLPIILVVCGAILYKSKKKISKLFLIVGGTLLGLLVLGFFFSIFANMFLLM